MGRLEEIIPEINWRESIRQARTAFGPVLRVQPQTVLALRVYVLHWVADGLLRMHGAHWTRPPVADRDAIYRSVFETVNKNTPPEWQALLRDLIRHLPHDAPGVRTLVHLLLGLEILNAECQRRCAHRTTRHAVEAWRRGDAGAEKAFYALTRSRKVYGKPLEAWYAPLKSFQCPPRRTDTRSAKAAVCEEHDGVCLEALAAVVTAYEAAVADVAAGRVEIPPLPPGPFASLLPIRRPWWTPCAAHVCAEHIQASLAALYGDTDDSIESYPLKAKKRLKDHYEKCATGRLSIANVLTMGARLPTGRRKGAPYQTLNTTRLGKICLEEERATDHRTPAPETPPPVAPPDFAEQIEAFVTKRWGRRMWEALCLKIKTHGPRGRPSPRRRELPKRRCWSGASPLRHGN